MIHHKKYFIALMLLLGSCSHNYAGTVTVKNESHRDIAQVHIKVCDQTLDAGKISPSQEISKSYQVTHDSSYEIHIVFADGQTLDKTDGYVTNGLDFSDRIVVSDQTITLIPSAR